jgi:hypothetical protein
LGAISIACGGSATVFFGSPDMGLVTCAAWKSGFAPNALLESVKTVTTAMRIAKIILFIFFTSFLLFSYILPKILRNL